jgi:TrkA domain protein
MVDVRRVKLPGVGVLHTFVTDDGGKVGVISHRSGHSDLIPGLSIDWFHVDYDDHIAGQAIGNMTDRGLPGVTVVAIVRGESANPAPDVDFKVFPGDTLVVAGAPEKVAKAFLFYRTGEFKARADSVDAPPGR